MDGLAATKPRTGHMSAEASRRERKGRLPKASGGRYGIDARAHGVDLSASAARRSSNSGAPVWNAAATSSRAYRRECAPLSRAFRIVGGSADPVAVPLARPPGPYIYTLPLLSRTYSFAADRVVGQQGGYGMAAQIAVMTLRPPVPAPAHNAAGRCGSGNSASSRRGTPSGSFGRVVLTARHLASRLRTAGAGCAHRRRPDDPGFAPPALARAGRWRSSYWKLPAICSRSAFR